MTLNKFLFMPSLPGSPIMLGANHIPDPEGDEADNATHVPDAERGDWNNATHTLDHEALLTTTQNASAQSDDTGGFICAFYNPDFIIYSSLGSFYIPCFVMIFLYARIFKALHQRATIAKMAKQKKQQAMAASSTITAHDKSRTSLVPTSRRSSRKQTLVTTAHSNNGHESRFETVVAETKLTCNGRSEQMVSDLVETL